MDDMDDGVWSNRVSENVCRTCGRRGCEGGPSCEMAAERRADYEQPVRCPYCGCELSVAPDGSPIPHDHVDDSPNDSISRSAARDPYGWGGY